MMATEIILLFGANGQLGFELQHALKSLGQVVALGREQADFSQPDTLRAVVRHHRPTIIVNAAAYTAVDKAESDADMAHTVNGLAPGVLAEEAQALGAVLVCYSTDYVFDGRKATAYVESDAPHPLSVYGRSKLLGEQEVAKACQRHLIFRTSWVVGRHGHNFLKTILRLARERDGLRVVADQIGAPTSAEWIARMTEQVLQVMQNVTADDARWGLYHLVPGGETSWHGLASHVVAMARQQGYALRVAPEHVVAIRTDEYPLPAVRPANSRLDTTKLAQRFALDRPDWQEGVDRILMTLMASDIQQGQSI